MDNVITYFNGEKLQCSIGAIVSITFIAVAIFFLIQDNSILKGMAYVVVPLSVLLLAICVAVIFRTSGDIKRVTTFYRESAERIRQDEIPRMEKVMKSFNTIIKIEIAILIIGLFLIVFFGKNEWIRGVAAGLIMMGLLLFIFDYVAAARGEKYLMYLKSL